MRSATSPAALRAPEGEKPLARRRCVCARESPASICDRCPEPVPPAASRMTIWTPIFARPRIWRGQPALQPRTAVEDIKMVGLRRKIAERMQVANARIPHFTYVEEVDVTALEELRARSEQATSGRPAQLTLLPFLMRAMVKAIAEQPNLNALFDDEAGVLHRTPASISASRRKPRRDSSFRWSGTPRRAILGLRGRTGPVADAAKQGTPPARS